MMRSIKSLLPIAALALGLVSCDQKDLCMDHWEHAPKLDFNVNIDWEYAWQYTYPGGVDWKETWNSDRFGMTYASLLPTKPEGVKAYVYDNQGTVTVSNLSPDGGQLPLPEGMNQLLFVNGGTEYIQFSDMNTVASATATTRAVVRSTFSADDNPVYVPGADKTVNPPDMLFGYFIDAFDAVRRPGVQNIDVTMKPLVFSYLIRYKVDQGLKYVGLARGALSGMAGSVFLCNGHTGANAVTIVYDCDVKDGYIEAKVKSFGVPDFPNSLNSGPDKPFALNLEVRLKNGRMLKFSFDISDQMRTQPRGGVIEVGGISIPDTEGEIGGTGGFDIDVEGWGDYIDVPILWGSGE